MTDPKTSFRLGVDVGGTFTDLVVTDGAGEFLGFLKVATTPPDPSSGKAGSVVTNADNGSKNDTLATLGTLADLVSLCAPVVPAGRWAPYRVASVLLGDQDAPCRDSRATVCPVPGHPCLDSVTPEDVVAAVDKLVPA